MKVAVMLLFMANLANGMLVPSNLNSFSINKGADCYCLARQFSSATEPRLELEDFNSGVREHLRRIFHGSRLGAVGFVASVIGASVITSYKLIEKDNVPGEEFFAGLYGMGTAMMMYSHFHKEKAKRRQVQSDSNMLSSNVLSASASQQNIQSAAEIKKAKIIH